MSQAAVAQPASVPATTKSKIEPWDTKELKKQLKANEDLYKQISDGLHVVPPSEEYTNNTKKLAKELLDKVTQFKDRYKESYESTETKRVASIKPRLCDKRLSNFLADHFKRYLPDNGQHGVLDLNRIVPRAISIYIKEKGLGATQFFTLDEKLKELFEYPSIENKEKTYIQLAQDRIAEIRMEKEFKQSPSSAEIFVENGRITMNYSALKIIIPKFGIKYDLTDPGIYISELEVFNKYLEQLHAQHEEAKKAAKKEKKA